jgi:DNA polymerase I-like protein with 3'-5' exonuclease and polymerase domains
MKINFDTVPPRWPDIVAVDLETTGLDPHRDHLLAAAVYGNDQVWLFLHTGGFKKLKPMLEDPDILKLFQNAKFDMKWFLKRGIRVNNIYDTMLADAVIESGRGLPMDLASIAARRAGTYLPKAVREEFFDHPGFDKKSLTAEQQEYMVHDVAFLSEIRDEQLRLISKAHLERVVDVEFSIVPALVELELTGLRLDAPMWFEQLNWFQLEVARLDTLMRQVVGDYVLEVPGKKAGRDIIKEISAEEINFNSPAQLKTLLNNRFGMPVDSTSKILLAEALDYMESSEEFSALDVLAGKGLVGGSWTDDAAEFVKLHLDRKKWAKMIGFGYDEFINPLTERVHPSFHQMGARTGRFSCTDPNMQQVPKPSGDGPNMRQLWRADDDESVILRADYSQQEPRIMAYMSGDEAMIRACNEEDVYLEFAYEMYGRRVDKKSPERQYAKTFVLAVGYGAGVNKLHKASGLPVEECERIKHLIQAKFPVMAQYGNKQFAFLQTYGYVTTALGRKRYVDEKGKRIFTEAVNTPIQGTGADMFKLALAKIYSSLTELKKHDKIKTNTRVWNLVHDELEVHCHKDEVSVVEELVRQGMEQAGYDLCPSVKHIASVEWGARWDK